MDRRHILKIVVFALVGASISLALLGRVRSSIGPFETTATVRPSMQGETTVRLSPLGTIRLDTHTGPVRFELQVDELRLDAAEAIARDPSVLDDLEDELAGDARRTFLLLAARSLLVVLAGAALGALLATPTLRSALVGLGAGAVSVLGIGGLAAATFDADAVAEPRYTGVLAVAPTAVGDVESIVNRFGEYRAQLTELVGNVVTLYETAQGLPSLATASDAIRVLHVSDIHNNPQAFDLAGRLVEQYEIDVVVDTGDITDWGTQAESQLLEQIGRLRVPYVYVRGNHDSRQTQRAVAEQPNAVVLDGDAADVAGLRFWGIGDPRYTPEKDQPVGTDHERDRIEAFAPAVRNRLLADGASTVDVLLIHDARGAVDAAPQVPLVLAGHRHKQETSNIGATTVLFEGSTGGTGLRGLQGEEPRPLTCSVLYFDRETRRLVAADRIIVDGIGGTGVRIEREVFGREPADR